MKQRSLVLVLGVLLSFSALMAQWGEQPQGPVTLLVFRFMNYAPDGLTLAPRIGEAVDGVLVLLASSNPDTCGYEIKLQYTTENGVERTATALLERSRYFQHTPHVFPIGKVVSLSITVAELLRTEPVVFRNIM